MPYKSVEVFLVPPGPQPLWERKCRQNDAMAIAAASTGSCLRQKPFPQSSEQGRPAWHLGQHTPSGPGVEGPEDHAGGQQQCLAYLWRHSWHGNSPRWADCVALAGLAGRNRPQLPICVLKRSCRVLQQSNNEEAGSVIAHSFLGHLLMRCGTVLLYAICNTARCRS